MKNEKKSPRTSILEKLGIARSGKRQGKSKTSIIELVGRLRDQNTRLESIIHMSPAALMIANSNSGAIIEVNDSWKKILGYDSDAIIHKPGVLPLLFIYDEEFNTITGLVESEGAASNIRCSLYAKDKEPRIVQLYATAFQQNSEKYYLFNFCDLTEALTNEKIVLNYDHKIRNLEKALDASSLISVTDAQGLIIYANAKFCEVSEYSRNELLGQNHRIINSGYHSKEFIKGLWTTINSGQVWNGVIRNKKKGGGYYWVQSSIIPFIDKWGKPYQFYSIRQDITERKKYEEDLEYSRKALVQAQELARLGTWEWNAVEDKATWSDEMYRIYGVPAEKGPLTFQEIPNYYTSNTWTELSLAVQRTLEQGSPFNMECEIIRQDKSHAWVIASGAAMRTAEGAIHGICGTVQDITERKFNDERNRLIVKALPDLIFILNHQGVFLDYHASDVSKLAFPPEQFLGKPFHEIFSPEISSRMEACINAVSKENLSRSIEYTLSLDGKSLYFEAGFSKLDSGRIMVVVRDITERKQADKKVLEQATLLDKAGDAILVRTLDHRIQYWNRGAETVYGWAGAEAIGSSARDLLYEHPEEFDAAEDLVIRHGEFNGELRQITKDRRQITVHARWTLVRDDNGNPKSVLAINSDITDRKKLEQQFLRAQRLESIGTLAGGIAHDLNNVMTPIMLAAAVLRTGNLSDDQFELITMIEKSVKHGTSMLRQVLSFARGAEGHPVPMKVTDLISELGLMIRETFPRNITMQSEVAENLWQIRGDVTQLHQVLMNLAVNARDAMAERGVLTIAAENRVLDEQYAGMQIDVKPGRYVVIRIEDSGTGMPQAVLEKIFEPFFTTKEPGKGTGLGLSTSLAIVKGHGGFMRVYSEPGKGTRFHIYLPALSLAEEKVAHAEIEEMPRGNGELILVVDDEATIRSITKQTLEAFGYAVKTASDGADAVAIFAEHKDKIALVLTDMMMPVLDGAGTIHVLRKMKPDIPIIAASGLDGNGKVAQLLGDGVKFFLPKPYTADVLLKTIKQALSKDQHPAE